MSMRKVTCGFIPLTDAAPLIIAHEVGFAREEGLHLSLQKAPSWSTLRERLAVGTLDAAHMLAPLPIAMSMGLGGGMTVPLMVPSVLSVNGTVIGVSTNLAERLAGATLGDPWALGQALVGASGNKPLRVGVPFPYSTHTELLQHWTAAVHDKQPDELQVRTVPPPLMAEALRCEEIDMFVVGEPWGSLVVESGVGELILPGAAIWSFAPEKVLAMRAETIESDHDLVYRLVRALWGAGRWLANSSNRMIASEILSHEDYLGISAEIIERALRGTLAADLKGRTLSHPALIEFHKGAASFPWRSQAIWIARRIAARNGIGIAEADQIARACFRPDFYRKALSPLSADLPGASEKIEGFLTERTAVASRDGTLFLGPDNFFDGQIFDFA